MKHIYMLLIILFPCAGFSQIITGTVKDVQQKPLAGITVSEKGTHQGTLTDENGKFKIKVTSDDPVLTFSAANMQTLGIKVDGQKDLEITLNPSRITSESGKLKPFRFFLLKTPKQ